jgi:hypothetical protein
MTIYLLKYIIINAEFLKEIKMQKHLRYYLIVIFICLIHFKISAQNFVPILGLTNSGTGTRAAGMGFAYTAISDDMSAFTWNPAGLGQLEMITFEIEGKVNCRIRGNDLDNYEQPKTFGDYWFNFAGIGIPIDASFGKFSVGLGIRKLYLWNDIEHSPVYYYDHEGGINTFGLVAALNLWNSLSFGIAYHDVSGDARLKRSEPIDIKVSGNIIELGIIYKTSFGLQLGGKYSMPSDLKTDVKDYSTSTGWFSFNFTGKYTITAPDFYNIGITFLASENLTLAFDFHSEPWSASRMKSSEWEENLKWINENANSIHLGLEYRGYKHPIRFGFCTVPTVFQDDKENQIKYYSLNTGTGFLWQNVNFDISLEYLFGSSKWEYEYNPERTYSESLNEFRLGFNASYQL